MDVLVSEFTQSIKPDYKAIVEHIDAAIEAAELPLIKAVKWGQLTYAKNGDFHHWICAIKVTKNFVGLTFHFGGLLSDPAGLFIIGTSKFSRKIEYRQPGEVDAGVIQDFIGQALDRLEYFKANWQEIQKGG